MRHVSGLPHAPTAPSARITWIVLCDGRHAQIAERCRCAGGEIRFHMKFEKPLTGAQLFHEWAWHGVPRIANQHPARPLSLLESLARLLEDHWECGNYHQLVFVGSRRLWLALKAQLPAGVQACVERCIEKDLTHCQPEGLAAYFSQSAE